MDQIPSTILVPERFSVGITNHRALAALRSGDLEQFRLYLVDGVTGAQALGSEKRLQDSIANWKEARKIRLQEPQVLELVDLLLELRRKEETAHVVLSPGRSQNEISVQASERSRGSTIIPLLYY